MISKPFCFMRCAHATAPASSKGTARVPGWTELMYLQHPPDPFHVTPDIRELLLSFRHEAEKMDSLLSGAAAFMRSKFYRRRL